MIHCREIRDLNRLDFHFELIEELFKTELRDSERKVYRASTDAQALSNIQDWLNQHISRFGSLSQFDRVTLANYFVTRPFARHPAAIVSLGKGLSPESAKLSAVYESFERWCAETLPSPVISVSEELSSHRLFKDQKVKPYLKKPNSYWSIGYDLISECAQLVPINKVAFPIPDQFRSSLFYENDTNGLASGPTLSDAIVHAILELLERDCIHKKSLRDSQAITNGFPKRVMEILSEFQKAGVKIALYDRSIYEAMNCFYAISKDRKIKLNHFFCSGAGMHFNSEKALERAITELSQSRVAMFAAIRHDANDVFNRFSNYFYSDLEAQMNVWIEPQKSISYKSIAGPNTIKQIIELLKKSFLQQYPNGKLIIIPIYLKGPYTCRAYSSSMTGYMELI